MVAGLGSEEKGAANAIDFVWFTFFVRAISVVYHHVRPGDFEILFKLVLIQGNIVRTSQGLQGCDLVSIRVYSDGALRII